MSSFYLACTGVFISSIKMLCFSDGFLQLLRIFSDCGVACCMSSLERHPGKSASGAVRWVPILNPLFPQELTSEQPRFQEEGESDWYPACLRQSRALLRPAGGTSLPRAEVCVVRDCKRPLSDGSVCPFCGQVCSDKSQCSWL